MAQGVRASASSFQVCIRTPQSAKDLFPSLASEMSRYLSGPFFGTAPFGSMMTGLGRSGSTHSSAPWNSQVAIFWPSTAFTSGCSHDLWLGLTEGITRQSMRG